MAKRKKHGGSPLDKLYAKIMAAKKASRGHVTWRKGTEHCRVDAKGKHPCTTEYVSKSGKKVKVKVSRTASFGMPKRLRSLSDLRGAPGVRLPANLKSKFKYKAKRRRSRAPKMTAAEQGRQELLAAARRISTGRSR
jgi:hypothetical protein